MEENNELNLQDIGLQEEAPKELRISPNAPEVVAIINSVDFSNESNILSYGANITDELSKSADAILRDDSLEKVKTTEKITKSLVKIMDRVDPAEFEIKERKGLGKLFGAMSDKGGDLKKEFFKLQNKCTEMEHDVQNVYVEIKSFEKTTNDSTEHLKVIYDSNVRAFQELGCYIVAGEEILKELVATKEELQKQLEETGDASLQFQITELEQKEILFRQKLQDLRVSETIALQSIPMLKVMALNNLNLIRKINSTLTLNIPVFKQALAQAVILKQQAITGNALSKVDEMTNQMLIQNAKTTMNQAVVTNKLANSSGVKTETLKEVTNVLTQGVKEVDKARKEMFEAQEKDKVTFDEMYKELMGVTQKNIPTAATATSAINTQEKNKFLS